MTLLLASPWTGRAPEVSGRGRAGGVLEVAAPDGANPGEGGAARLSVFDGRARA